jgi:hypothetical protein
MVSHQCAVGKLALYIINTSAIERWLNLFIFVVMNSALDLSYFIKARKIMENPVENCLDLTGFSGIHTMEEIQTRDQDIIYYINDKKFPESITINFRSNLIARSSIKIDIYQNRIIIEDIKASGRKPRSVLRSFCKQVEAARKFGFKYVFLTAEKGNQELTDEIYTGFYTWAEYGFLMHTIDEYIDFLNLMKSRGLRSRSLYDLVREPEGKNMWALEGSTWNGYFDLHPDSISSLIFNHMSKKLLRD